MNNTTSHLLALQYIFKLMDVVEDMGNNFDENKEKTKTLINYCNSEVVPPKTYFSQLIYRIPLKVLMDEEIQIMILDKAWMEDIVKRINERLDSIELNHLIGTKKKSEWYIKQINLMKLKYGSMTVIAKRD